MPVYAVPFGFHSITNNRDVDAAIGEAQLFVDITYVGWNSVTGFDQVLFTFRNIGPEECSITQIYFDDYGNKLLIGSEDSKVFISSSEPDVVFSEITDSEKLKLPAGKNVNFTTEYGAGADEPPPKNGVNPSESLGILFDLDASFGDLLDGFELDFPSTRIGMHVIGFASKGSESFVNYTEPTTLPVPEPDTMFLLGLGLIGLAGVGRKKLLKK